MHRRLIPRSLHSRLLLTYLALMLLGLGGMIVWTGLRLQVAVVEQAEHDLELEALIMANALREPLDRWRKGKGFEGRSLPALVRSYAESVGVRVTVIDPSLRVLLSSDDIVPAHFEHDHPELVAAREGLEQHDIRGDEWRNEERLFVAASIMEVEDEEKELEGFVQLSVPMAPLYAEMRRTWTSLVMAGSVVLIATALVSLLLARQVAGPIGNLTAVTEGMAAGNLDQQVTPAGPDEIERLGRAFNRMAERVREMLARHQTFVANAAHELRSPLTSLRLRIDILQRHSQNNPELAMRYLQQMGGEVEYLRRLVDHLLVLSRLDEGQELRRESLDLAPILYEVADEMGPLVQASGLDLAVDVPPHLPAVAANIDPMRMVVRNLLDNAIKYTPAGGRIRLRAMTADGRPLDPSTGLGTGFAQVSSRGSARGDRRPTALTNATAVGGQQSAGVTEASSTVIIQVSDTGPGIPTEHLPHIFDRFYRADKTRSRRHAGAGLGLSLVRSIVEAHSGEVSVESTPGAGSTFTVRLPATTSRGDSHRSS
ncbi:MAG: sensor histidine kinase [Anaerolineae bacterium]